MPWIISVLLGGLIQIVGSLVGRVIVALGFGFVEYIGFSTMLGKIGLDVEDYMKQVGMSELAAWAGFFRIDVHVTILLSAIGVKLLLNSLSSDKITRLVQR